MGRNVGTLRKVVIDGVTYDVFADCNISFNRTDFEIEGQATTGKTLFKMKRRIQNIEGLDLATTPAEMETLKSKSDSLADKTLAVTLADGSTYRSTGRVHYDKYESETGKSTVKLIPSGTWTPFLAN